MFQHVNDQELNLKMKQLAAAERKLTRVMIEHIAEVDRRKLYLKLNFDSLFAYLTREIGYTNGSAQRRIDAARLILRCPEVAEQIQVGSVNLSQISKFQMNCREVAKVTGQKVSLDLQKEVLQKIQNQRESATDLILAQEFQTEIKMRPKTQIQRDESVRLEITFTKEEMEILRSAQALLSNKTGGGLKESLVESAKRVIKSHEPKNKKSTATVVVNSPGSIVGKTATTVVAKAGIGSAKSEQQTSETADRIPKSMTPRLKREARKGNVGCQFRDAAGRVCGSKFFLEVDHIRPKYVGGGNERANLRMLCKSHN
ncbi:MAG: HNH endonuclease, partial [Bdellovibrionales bacterium]|nr:HNH endonuclease [Bdellovibrionales bacterium]